jgi:hypothetical protein
MWIKKTNKEIQEYKEPFINWLNKHNIVLFVLAIPLVTILLFFIDIIYGEDDSPGRMPKVSLPMSMNEAIQKIPSHLIELTLVFSILYIFFFFIFKVDKNENHASFVCDKCNKLISKLDDKNKCECGGAFIPIDKMKWINDEDIQEDEINDDDIINKKL